MGLAVGGYGAESAIFGPLAQLKLIPTYGLPAMFQILGAIFLVMTMVGALLLRTPTFYRVCAGLLGGAYGDQPIGAIR